MKAKTIRILCILFVGIVGVLVLQNFRQSRSGQRLSQQALAKFEYEKDIAEFRLMQNRQSQIENALRDGRAVVIRCPAVKPEEWMSRIERPVGDFAKSNKIEIIQFANAAQPSAEVRVWAKDAEKVRAF